jgi:hypothetical protein
LFKLNEVGATDLRVLMDALKMRVIPQARNLDICGPCSLAEVSDCFNEGGPVGPSAGRGGQIV